MTEALSLFPNGYRNFRTQGRRRNAGRLQGGRRSGRRIAGGRRSGRRIADGRRSVQRETDRRGGAYLRVRGRAAGRRHRTSQVGFAGRRRKALQQGNVAGSGGARRGIARQISASEVGRQGGVAGRCRWASQGSVARRCSRATLQGQAAQGRASQGKSPL